MSRILLASARPVDAKGVPIPGYIVVGTASNGKVYLDASRDATLPTGATVVSTGTDRYTRTALGTHADRVLDATWEQATGTEGRIAREKMHAALARNPTITILEFDLPPHRWLGE